MDALIGETCRDDDVLQELMTYKEVFESVELHLAQKGQEYAPRTILDLVLLKQYTAQLLKQGEYHLGRVAASRIEGSVEPLRLRPIPTTAKLTSKWWSSEANKTVLLRICIDREELYGSVNNTRFWNKIAVIYAKVSGQPVYKTLSRTVSA